MQVFPSALKVPVADGSGRQLVAALAVVFQQLSGLARYAQVSVPPPPPSPKDPPPPPHPVATPSPRPMKPSASEIAIGEVRIGSR